jgi:sec-independent protein translocase protein TatA
MPFGFHPIYLLVLLVVVLIIFGPGKLPELGSAVGRAMRQFREATSDIKDEVTRAAEPQPAQPAPEASAAPTTTTATTAAAPSTETAPARTRRASKARTDSDKA